MLRIVASRSVRAVAIPTKPAYRDLDPETRELYKKIIRVDHAGERGADVIYNGQYDVLKNTDAGPKIKEMWEQEKEHLAAFEKLLVTHRTAPTVLLPLWDVIGKPLSSSKTYKGMIRLRSWSRNGLDGKRSCNGLYSRCRRHNNRTLQ